VCLVYVLLSSLCLAYECICVSVCVPYRGFCGWVWVEGRVDGGRLMTGLSQGQRVGALRTPKARRGGEACIE
jgi:hypothetical protein